MKINVALSGAIKSFWRRELVIGYYFRCEKLMVAINMCVMAKAVFIT
jgi:hypothetical protein